MVFAGIAVDFDAHVHVLAVGFFLAAVERANSMLGTPLPLQRFSRLPTLRQVATFRDSFLESQYQVLKFKFGAQAGFIDIIKPICAVLPSKESVTVSFSQPSMRPIKFFCPSTGRRVLIFACCPQSARNRRLFQRPVKAGAGNFQIFIIDVFHHEHAAQMIADGRAVFNGDTAFFIDEHAQRLAQSARNRPVRSPNPAGFFENCLNIHESPGVHKQKMAPWPFSSK